MPSYRSGHTAFFKRDGLASELQPKVKRSQNEYNEWHFPRLFASHVGNESSGNSWVKLIGRLKSKRLVLSGLVLVAVQIDAATGIAN